MAKGAVDRIVICKGAANIRRELNEPSRGEEARMMLSSHGVWLRKAGLRNIAEVDLFPQPRQQSEERRPLVLSRPERLR